MTCQKISSNTIVEKCMSYVGDVNNRQVIVVHMVAVLDGQSKKMSPQEPTDPPSGDMSTRAEMNSKAE
jgi:hypothetical protein